MDICCFFVVFCRNVRLENQFLNLVISRFLYHFLVFNYVKLIIQIRCVKEKGEVPESYPLATLHALLRVVGPWPNKHNLITLQIKVSYLSADFK